MFAAYDDNWGLTRQFLESALKSFDLTKFHDGELSMTLLKAFSVIQKLGLGEKLVAFFQEGILDKFFRPFFEAVKGLEYGNKQYFLNIAPEIRTPTESFYEIMLNYQKSE